MYNLRSESTLIKVRAQLDENRTDLLSFDSLYRWLGCADHLDMQELLISMNC